MHNRDSPHARAHSPPTQTYHSPSGTSLPTRSTAHGRTPLPPSPPILPPHQDLFRRRPRLADHRLFLSVFMIASKVVCDDMYSNWYWAIVGQVMFALRETARWSSGCAHTSSRISTSSGASPDPDRTCTPCRSSSSLVSADNRSPPHHSSPYGSRYRSVRHCTRFASLTFFYIVCVCTVID